MHLYCKVVNCQVKSEAWAVGRQAEAC